MCHFKSCVQPCLDSAMEDGGIGKTLRLRLGRLTDGRCVARSASVEDQRRIARERCLSPFEVAE
jgi:hypothetical protein